MRCELKGSKQVREYEFYIQLLALKYSWPTMCVIGLLSEHYQVHIFSERTTLTKLVIKFYFHILWNGSI